MNRESGFTIVELMLSVIILVVGLLGLASAMASMTRQQDLTSNRTEMGMLAEAKLEQLRLAAAQKTADTIQVMLGPGGVATGSLTSSVANRADTVAGRRLRYVRRWVVSQGLASTRQVALRISPLVDDRRTPAQLNFVTQVLQ